MDSRASAAAFRIGIVCATTLLVCATIFLLCATIFAQFEIHHERADVLFARLEYTGFYDDKYLKNWYTDYPAADEHFTIFLNRVTNMRTSGVLVSPSSDDLYRYPLLYTVEPEQMKLSDFEVRNLREYLYRGGFWFVDDFHGDIEFDAFRLTLERILPSAYFVELDTAHSLFHIFYDIEQIEQVVNDSLILCRPSCDHFENGESGRIPKVFAVFLPGTSDISIVVSFNNDLGDGWEHADNPIYPPEQTTFAVKFGVNVVLYS